MKWLIAIGWVKVWWHCLWRLHRMSSIRSGDDTVWVGCGDCYKTTYDEGGWDGALRFNDEFYASKGASRRR